MTAADLTALLAALGALAGVVMGYVAKAQEVKRASHVQEQAGALQGYDKLTRALQERLEIVEQKLSQAEKRIDELEDENTRLREQIGAMKVSMGSQPARP